MTSDVPDDLMGDSCCMAALFRLPWALTKFLVCMMSRSGAAAPQSGPTVSQNPPDECVVPDGLRQAPDLDSSSEAEVRRVRVPVPGEARQSSASASDDLPWFVDEPIVGHHRTPTIVNVKEGVL